MERRENGNNAIRHIEKIEVSDDLLSKRFFPPLEPDTGFPAGSRAGEGTEDHSPEMPGR